MPDATALTLFFGASLALVLVPGPAVLYIVTRSISQGRTAGILSVIGIGIGNLFHVVAAGLGVSAILMSSAVAFQVVKLLGAAYLMYLGIRTLRRKDEAAAVNGVSQQPAWRILSQGVIVNILNPKVALFFLAFLPQFVNVSAGNVTGQIILLGMIFTILAIVTDSIYALLSGTVGSVLRGNIRFLRGQRYVAGGVYITLGVATALSGSERQ